MELELEKVAKELDDVLVTIFDKHPKIKYKQEHVDLTIPEESLKLTVFSEGTAIFGYKDKTYYSSDCGIEGIRDLLLKKICGL